MIKSLFKKNIKELRAPIDGQLISLTNVNDEAFSSHMLGDGCAIIPSGNKVYAPCDGVIKFIFPTKHAIGMVNDDGLELIIHIGIDTVSMNGVGFESYCQIDQRVKSGDLLVEFNEEYLHDDNIDLTSPLIISNFDILKKYNVLDKDKVSANEAIIEYQMK